MNAATPDVSVCQKVGRSHPQPKETRVKNPAQTVAVSKDTARERFAALLWRAFPAPSERALARRAAVVLGVSERQVINWLRCDHDAACSYVFAVMAIAGAEIVFERIAS